MSALLGAELEASRDRVRHLQDSWDEVVPTDRVRRHGIRLLRTHPLRAVHVLQLSAAIVAAEDDSATLPFVTLDERLKEAASKEGFAVVWPSAA